jgi:hypothetical protein
MIVNRKGKKEKQLIRFRRRNKERSTQKERKTKSRADTD